jgi:hypothetical protein
VSKERSEFPAKLHLSRPYFQSQDKELERLRAELQRSTQQVKNKRLIGVQDLAWALINSPALLFNR